MAFTSGVADAQSDKGHSVQIRAAGQTRSALLPNLPGDDYYQHKGDLWKMSFSSHFHFNGCIHVQDIEDIAIEEHSNDGWHIESIVTFLRSGGYYQLASVNMEVNRWIDGDGHYSSVRFDLNLVI